MRYFKLLTLSILLGTLAFPSLQAQDIDQERMQRDVNIMESVLEEMFKSEWENRDVKIQVLNWGNEKNVRGTYLEDYGLLFTIRGGIPSIITILNSEKGNKQAPVDDPEEQVFKEDIIKRISEFMGDYAPTIGQLNSRDKVTVIFNADINRNSPAYTLLSDSRGDINVDPNRDPLPTIQITATKEDLQAFRTGKIDRSEFENRLTVSTAEENKSKQRDLKIMANILKTTFEDAENDEFRIRSSVNYLYLDNYGALFNAKSSYGSGLYGLSIAMGKLSEKISASLDNRKDSVKVSNSKDDANKNTDLERKQKKAYQHFLTQTKEIIIDYGSTLSSVQPNEHILISLEISTSGNSVPERLDLRIKKSVLEAVNSGNMNRERAMREINVREY